MSKVLPYRFRRQVKQQCTFGYANFVYTLFSMMTKTFFIFLLISTFFYLKCFIIVHTISADILRMQWYRQIDFWCADLSLVQFHLCYYLKAKMLAYLEVLLSILVLVNVVCPKVSNNSYSNWSFLGHTRCYFILRNH